MFIFLCICHKTIRVGSPKKSLEKYPVYKQMLEMSIVVCMICGFIGGCLSVAVEPVVTHCIRSRDR